MFYTAEKRKAYLDDLKNNSKPIKDHQFEYDGNPTYTAPVYKIKLDYLIFNQFNARIADELKTYQAVGLGEDQEYNEALEEKIKKILWEQGGKNKATLEDIKVKGQMEPGVVTADGVIVSGNRRGMLLSELGREYFEGVILDEAYEGNKTLIVRLEASLQNRVIGAQEYGATAKQFAVHTMRKEHNLSWEEISYDMNETESKVKQYYEEMMTMLEYLQNIGTPNVYTNLRIQGKKGTKEEVFRETNKHYKKMVGANASLKIDWAYNDDNADQYKEVMYDFIRAYNLGAPAMYRRIGPGTGEKKGILANEALWKDFYEAHTQITHDVTANLKSFAEYASMQEYKDLEPKEIAEVREQDWVQRVGDALRDNYEEYVDYIEALNKESEPGEKIRKALSHLSGISEEDMLILKESPKLSVINDQLSEMDSKITKILQIIEEK